MATPFKTSSLIPPKAPNLPIAPVDYAQQYQDQLLNALRLYFNQIDNFGFGLLNSPVGGAFIKFPYGSFYQNGVTTLSANITNVSTTAISAADTTEFGASGYILIGSEAIQYTSKTATQFDGTITRGVLGTTNVAHTAGAYITEVVDGKWVLPIVKEGLERLQKELALVQPNVIVAFGNLSFWALTGAWGVLKWRGSQLQTPTGLKVIPTLHPKAILAQWEHRAAVVTDLKRAAKECGGKAYTNTPKWEFLVRPSFHQAYDILKTLLGRAERSPEPIWIDFDLETRAGHIACAGLSWSRTEAVCIPFMCVENKEGYWQVDEEAVLVHNIYRLLTHPKVNVRGQNLLYDAQYTYRHWHFVPRVKQDTMISHHTMFAGLPKRLDYQASLYCDHYVYWKDDGKTWTKELSEDQLWKYNCIDCVRTREVGEVELTSIAQMNLGPVEEFQQALFWPVLKAMQLGVRIDTKRRAILAMELQEELTRREEFFIEVLGHSLNPRSSPQMAKLFYSDLNIPPIYSRPKKGQPAHLTCDEEALEKIKTKEPILIPLINIILQYRQIGVFLSTFILMPLDQDQRMRCSYNICGTETYRFSSSQNAFGSGGNLQNLPKGDE